jgi:hypothetical protein
MRRRCPQAVSPAGRRRRNRPGLRTCSSANAGLAPPAAELEERPQPLTERAPQAVERELGARPRQTSLDWASVPNSLTQRRHVASHFRTQAETKLGVPRRKTEKWRSVQTPMLPIHQTGMHWGAVAADRIEETGRQDGRLPKH